MNTFQILAHRRRRLADALQIGDAILLVGAGHPIPLPEGSDQTYAFRSHAEYFYLAGQECVGGILAYDPKSETETAWTSFVPAITEGERVWEGRRQTPGVLMHEFAKWHRSRSGRPVVTLGSPILEVAGDAILTAAARETRC